MISFSNTRLFRLLKFPPTPQLSFMAVVNCVPPARQVVVVVLPVLQGTVNMVLQSTQEADKIRSELT